MPAEIVSFGSWSKAYENLVDREAKKEIARVFGLTPDLLQSWIHSLRVIRNQCAHHSRLWNREISIKPKMNGRLKKKYPEQHNGRRRIVLILEILVVLLEALDMAENFRETLSSLLGDFPDVPRSSMGMLPDGWGAV